MSFSPSEALIVFLKYPEAGKVKTRLAKDTHLEFAASLYQNMVEDLKDFLDCLKLPVFYFYAPLCHQQKISNWLSLNNQSLMSQVEGDLGNKMKEAFLAIFQKGFQKVLIIGSDCLDLSQKLFEQVFFELGKGKVVLGPSKDGGYYLLGLSVQNFHTEFFEGIAWSTPQVLAQTLNSIHKMGEKSLLLPEKSDIDTLSDVKEFYQHIPITAKKSRAWLEKSKEIWNV